MNIITEIITEIKNFLNPKEEQPSPDVKASQEIEAEATKQQPQNSQPQQKGDSEQDKQTSTNTPNEPVSDPEVKQPSPEPEEKADKPDDNYLSAPQIRHLVIENITKMLRPLEGKDDFYGIKLFVTDKIVALSLDDTFVEQLRRRFDDRGFYSLGRNKIEIHQQSPSSVAENVYNEQVFAEILTKAIPVARHDARARITIFNGKGSLKKAEYLLDTAADNKTVYCIGRGDNSTKGGVYRQNDIVVNDCETDPEISSLNNYVSSSHANIEVTDGKFYLHAMFGGISNGNATKIIRDGKVNKLVTDTMNYQLYDGDLIELGRMVLLKFEIL